MSRDVELKINCGYHWKNNVDDKIEDATMYLEPNSSQIYGAIKKNNTEILGFNKKS